MPVNVICLMFIAVILQGCAGTRASYESLIETKGDDSAIYLSVGQTKEVLSISNGFPGWWGVYPAVVSFSPEIASVACKRKRSWIPFRSPGLIIGGEVCYLTANSAGETWLKYGNKWAMSIGDSESQDNKIKLVVSPK